jgi:Flp pilus assembly protein TadD, contains TPR repeats
MVFHLKNLKSKNDTLLRKYLKEENYEAGIRRSNKLLEKDANSSFLNNYLGYCLKNLNKVEESRKAFSKALTIQKDAPEIIYNNAKLDLKLGNFDIGWENYDAGLKFNLRKVFDGFLLNEKPIWDGKPFNGCLLIYGEQTISEQLIFSTVLEDLLKVHQNVAIVINKRLKKLFQRTYKNLTIFSDDEDLSNFDYDKHIPIGSLCNHFRHEVKDFDNCTETHLITCPEIDNQVKLLFPNTDGLKIGISWKDFDLIKNSTKYLTNSDVSKIIEFGNNTFINLQFGDVSNDMMQINDNSKSEI